MHQNADFWQGHIFSLDLSDVFNKSHKFTNFNFCDVTLYHSTTGSWFWNEVRLGFKRTFFEVEGTKILYKESGRILKASQDEFLDQKIGTVSTLLGTLSNEDGNAWTTTAQKNHISVSLFTSLCGSFGVVYLS